MRCKEDGKEQSEIHTRPQRLFNDPHIRDSNLRLTGWRGRVPLGTSSLFILEKNHVLLVSIGLTMTIGDLPIGASPSGS